jgi:hypothetical protein
VNVVRGAQNKSPAGRQGQGLGSGRADNRSLMGLLGRDQCRVVRWYPRFNDWHTDFS